MRGGRLVHRATRRIADIKIEQSITLRPQLVATVAKRFYNEEITALMENATWPINNGVPKRIH